MTVRIKALKFPDRFFRIHQERMRETLEKFGEGGIWCFKTKVSFSVSPLSDPARIDTSTTWTVAIKCIRSEKGLHIIPFALSDVKAAEAWELRYKDVDDNDLW